MNMPQTRVASIIGLMRITNPGRTILFAIVLLGVMDLPTTAFHGPQESVPPPSGETRPSSSQQPISTPAKQAGMLIEYKNKQYGFCFSLPQGWRGYSIEVDRWKGYSNGSEGDVIVQQGPVISIRHPQWTRANPRQNIPIMVFTFAQWRSLEREDFHISATPIGPSELGRNSRFVFGLPPCFDWTFPTGYEEVEMILRGNPLSGGCWARSDQH